MELVEWRPELVDQINKWDDTEKSSTIFLERHPDYPAFLLVNSFNPLYLHDFKGLLNDYRSINILKINELLEKGNSEGYSKAYFVGDLENIYSFLESLDDPYPYELNVELKKFQIRGFNYTKNLPSAIINWSTGTGKSVYSVARAKYLLEEGMIDKVIILSKSHNKINWQRTFDHIGSLRAEVDDLHSTGSLPSKKRETRAEMYANSQIIIINYEKMRFRAEATDKKDSMGRKRPDPSGDGQELLAALKGQRVLWIWDEMPNKMKKMSTAWYKGATKLLKATKKNYQVELTAKKLDTDPENVYSCTKILDKTIWTSISTFRALYAKRMSSFSPWQVAAWDTKKLPELGMRLAHITHIANKYSDPEIKAEFPEDHWEDVIIDMSPEDRKLYDLVATDVVNDLTGNYTELIAKITPLQLICDNPLLINNAKGQLAESLRQHFNWTDKNCAKLDVLREMLAEVDGKVVIFSMFNDLGSKMLAEYMKNWNVSFVLYSGINKQRQIAQDRFRSDPRIKVFLSSDMGSDSIDLEQATTVINYNLPWNHSTLIQRVNRISRLTSEADHVFYYNFITADTLEERKLKILERKRLFEEAIDSGIAEHSELISHSDLDELRYMVTG